VLASSGRPVPQKLVNGPPSAPLPSPGREVQLSRTETSFRFVPPEPRPPGPATPRVTFDLPEPGAPAAGGRDAVQRRALNADLRPVRLPGSAL